ncbi:MAG: nucleoside hydrolase [Planctomycetota bacterium]
MLDADTANEIDDLFAITRVVCQDRFETLCLNSAQWRHYLSSQWCLPGESSVDASHRFNRELLDSLGVRGLPLHRGSEEPLGKPWGGSEPKDSPAAQAIIAAARETPPADKLTVVCLGASTNLASAIAIEPAIVPRLRVYVLGFTYEHDRGVWNKSEFNIRRDLNAADLLLNTQGLELHVMPTNVAKDLTFDRRDTFDRLAELGPAGELLVDKWNARFEDYETWIMWDVALVEALLRPELAEQSTVSTPPENTPRQISVYSAIDAPQMRRSYWKALQRIKAPTRPAEKQP